jgi:hypothetical protein
MVNRKKDKQLSCFRYFCLFSCGGVQHILCCWFFSAACLPYVSSLSTLSTTNNVNKIAVCFSFPHGIICPYLIYGFTLDRWYLHTFLLYN